MPPLSAGGRRGGLARVAAAQAAAPTVEWYPSAGNAAAATSGTETRGIWRLGAVWRSLTRGVEFNLPFLGFLVYLATIVTNRFTVAQPAVVLAFFGLLGQRRPFRVGGLGLLFAAYITWAAVTVALSPYRGSREVMEAIENLCKLLIVFVIGVNAVRTRAQWRFVIAWILFWFAAYPGRGSYLNYITGANLWFGRVVWNGVYGNPNDLAVITLLMLGLAAALAVGERPGLVRTAARLGIPALALLISFTQSRGVLVALIVFTALALITSRAGKRAGQRVRKRPLRTAAAVGAAGVVFAVFAPESMWERLRGLVYQSDETNAEALSNDSSAQQRLEIWRVARTVIAENWATGVGAGGYPKAHVRTAARPQFKRIAGGARDTHSTYLNVLAEVGVVGFVLFMTMLLYTIVDAERTRRRVREFDPEGARSLLMLELGLVAYLIAGIWGSYGKLNMTYLMLLLVWTRARALEQDARRVPGPSGQALPGGQPATRRGRLLPTPA